MLTVGEVLSVKPRKAEYEWYADEAGLVHVKVPKFEGKVGNTFCRILRKDEVFTANMDELGSFVWKRCDGKTSVKEILEELQERFEGQENLDQRLFLFLRQMRQLRYLDF
jgi:hypothetical protein